MNSSRYCVPSTVCCRSAAIASIRARSASHTSSSGASRMNCWSPASVDEARLVRRVLDRHHAPELQIGRGRRRLRRRDQQVQRAGRQRIRQEPAHRAVVDDGLQHVVPLRRHGQRAVAVAAAQQCVRRVLRRGGRPCDRHWVLRIGNVARIIPDGPHGRNSGRSRRHACSGTSCTLSAHRPRGPRSSATSCPARDRLAMTPLVTRPTKERGSMCHHQRAGAATRPHPGHARAGRWRKASG